jgi:hypothetical protein
MANLITERILARTPDVLKFSVLLFFIIVQAYFITVDYHLSIALFGAISILILVAMSNTASVILFFLITFTGEEFTGVTFFSQIFTDILLLSLLFAIFAKAMIGKIIRREKIKFVGLLPLVVFVVVCIVSSFYNGSGHINNLIYLRFIFQFYVFFTALLNLDLSENQIKLLNTFIIGLLVIQIPTAIIKWFSFGYSDLSRSIGGERAVGTYGGAPGEMSTLLPLFAIAFLLPMFIWTRKKWNLLLIFGFILFSFLAGKRAFMIIVPFFVTVILYICYKHIQKETQKRTFVKYALTGLFVGILVLVIGVIINPTMNPTQEIGGAFDFNFLKERIINYETGTTSDNITTGRLSSSARVFSVLSQDGMGPMLLGRGPGVFVKSGVVESTFRSGYEDEFGILYGVTGFVWMSSQTGLLGVVVYLIFLWSLMKKVRGIDKEKLDLYWQIFRIGVLGAFVVVLFDYFGYSISFISGKPLPSIIYYVIAILIVVSENTQEEESLDTPE